MLQIETFAQTSCKLFYTSCILLVGIQSECGKICTRITPNTDTFHAVVVSKGFRSKSAKSCALKQLLQLIVNLITYYVTLFLLKHK